MHSDSQCFFGLPVELLITLRAKSEKHLKANYPFGVIICVCICTINSIHVNTDPLEMINTSPQTEETSQLCWKMLRSDCYTYIIGVFNDELLLRVVGTQQLNLCFTVLHRLHFPVQLTVGKEQRVREFVRENIKPLLIKKADHKCKNHFSTKQPTASVW